MSIVMMGDICLIGGVIRIPMFVRTHFVRWNPNPFFFGNQDYGFCLISLLSKDVSPLLSSIFSITHLR
jgi:hypothetical protein